MIPKQALDMLGQRSVPKVEVVQVAGVITEIDPDHKHGNVLGHQIFTVRVEEVLANPTGAGVAVNQLVNVAIRYGDGQGLANPIPDLAEGERITMQGDFVELKDAYPEADGDHNAVIHFTHHPVGWVEYKGKRYS